MQIRKTVLHRHPLSRGTSCNLMLAIRFSETSSPVLGACKARSGLTPVPWSAPSVGHGACGPGAFGGEEGKGYMVFVQGGLQHCGSSPGDKAEGCCQHVAVSLLISASAKQGHQAFAINPEAVCGNISDVTGVSCPPLWGVIQD